jgi:hypothetical protein
MPLKTGIKVVDKKDFNQVLGYLAEIPGFQVIEGEDDETFDDEMLVMSGFTRNDIDELIRSLKKHGVGRVDLKAIVTPTNSLWDCVRLYKAVKADHETMHKK